MGGGWNGSKRRERRKGHWFNLEEKERLTDRPIGNGTRGNQARQNSSLRGILFRVFIEPGATYFHDRNETRRTRHGTSEEFDLRATRRSYVLAMRRATLNLQCYRWLARISDFFFFYRRTQALHLNREELFGIVGLILKYLRNLWLRFLSF